MGIDHPIAVIVPALNRPHRVAEVVASIRDTTPDPDILFVLDPGDDATREEVAANSCRMISPGGNYARKINLGVRATKAPLIFLGADDLKFHSGWFETARGYLSDQVHVVGVNDLCSRRVRAGQHATHFLMTREYALRPQIDERPGPLCEEYDHSFVDDELVATARHRGALVFATDSYVEHLHPDAGKADWDPVYEKGRAHIRADRQLFWDRSHLWRA